MHVGSPLSHRYLYTSCEDTMELIEKTIGQCLREQAEKNGNHIAMEMGEWSCTFRQLDVVSDLLAVQMGGLGITRGTHVGIWSVNSPELGLHLRGPDKDRRSAYPHQYLL